MSDVYRSGRFEPLDWPVADADAALPAEGGVTLPKARWLAERDAIGAGNGGFAILLEPADGLDDIAGDLDRISVVSIRFPKFGDGWGFSLARLLRDKHGYVGEIRAVGDVLIDLIPFMGRVGFTAFEVTHEPTRAALAAGRLPLVPYFYQPAADAMPKPAVAGRPWLREAQ